MKILIVKIGAIGDVLMARGMIAAAPQGSQISWLCGKSVTPLVRQFDGVSEIIDVDDTALLQGGFFARLKVLLGIWMQLLGRRFDLVATGHSDSRYGLLSLTARAGLRRSFATHRLVPGRQHADEYARLIHGIDGPLAPSAFLKPLRKKVATKNKSALLFPGGAKNLLRDDALRRWPVGHYAALAKLLIGRGWKVSLGGAESDRWVLPAFKGLKFEESLGSMDLVQTLDACANARAVISHDSGPLHLALTTQARVVALFGPTMPDEKVQARPGVTVLWGGESLACRPCYDGKNYAPCNNNACMSVTTPAAVMAAIDARQ